MIGRISGTLLEKAPPSLLVDAHGVGYELEAPMSTFYKLPATGEAVALHVHMVVREDAQLLYGFGSKLERALFRELLKVSGVGAKVALSILSGMSADDFAATVGAGDANALVRLPGIGKKTAERLVVEMRDRVQALVPSALPGGLPGIALGDDSVAGQAMEALVSLGYKPAEAKKLVGGAVEAAGDASVSVEETIRAALKRAVR